MRNANSYNRTKTKLLPMNVAGIKKTSNLGIVTYRFTAPKLICPILYDNKMLIPNNFQETRIRSNNKLR